MLVAQKSGQLSHLKQESINISGVWTAMTQIMGVGEQSLKMVVVLKRNPQNQFALDRHPRNDEIREEIGGNHWCWTGSKKNDWF